MRMSGVASSMFVSSSRSVFPGLVSSADVLTALCIPTAEEENWLCSSCTHGCPSPMTCSVKKAAIPKELLRFAASRMAGNAAAHSSAVEERDRLSKREGADAEREEVMRARMSRGEARDAMMCGCGGGRDDASSSREAGKQASR